MSAILTDGRDGRFTSNGPLSIVVLLGGWSAEREISLASGHAVVRALRSRGHDVRELDPAEMDFCGYPWAGVDVAFIALHGPFGEDGTVQSLLKELRVPFTGSGPRASRLAMDKSAAKQRFVEQRLPTPHSRTVHANDASETIAESAAAIGLPLVVKPNAQGSTIGVSIVEKPEQLLAAAELAFRYDPILILETFIPGREMTVAVLDGQALPAIEIRPARGFFDYAAKYHDDATTYVFESDLPQAVFRQAESLAVAAVNAVGARGVARVDLRIDPNGQPWLLEVNTIPGMTDHSLVPKAAARAGISFDELCDRLVRRAAAPAHETPVVRAA